MHRSRWIILSFAILLFGCGKDPGVPEKIRTDGNDLVQREVNACVENTVDSAFENGRGSEREVAISIRELTDACGAVGFDPEDASVKFGVLRELLPELLQTVVPSARTEYGDWDKVLIANAVRVLNSGGKIREALDPGSRSVVVGNVAESLTLVNAEFDLHPSLANEAQAIAMMGASWGLRGFTLSDVEVRRVLNSLSNSIDPFLASTRTFILALSRDPLANMDTVEFADSLNLDFKTKARYAKLLAQEIKKTGWLTQVFDRILQRKLTEANLDSAIDRFRKCQIDQTLCGR